ncbi:hypothetical protein PO124_22975 [Bacillus licheniformis]|nr:hypothetical protein [Bacillus licheniformis]
MQESGKRKAAFTWKEPASSVLSQNRRASPYSRTISGLDQTEGQSAAHPFSRVKEARKQRIEAVTHGVAVMTEEETVRAF